MAEWLKEHDIRAVEHGSGQVRLPITIHGGRAEHSPQLAANIGVVLTKGLAAKTAVPSALPRLSVRKPNNSNFQTQVQACCHGESTIKECKDGLDWSKNEFEERKSFGFPRMPVVYSVQSTNRLQGARLRELPSAL